MNRDVTFVAFPGWATDHDVFVKHRLPGRVTSVPDGEGRISTIERMNHPVWLLGWSLGAHAALEIGATAPRNVRGVILAGIRPVYPADAISAIRARFAQNPQTCLTSFYRQCFHGAPKEWMNCEGKRLIDHYTRNWDAERLLDGLALLETKPLRIDRAGNLKVLALHGERDRIAPIDEARALIGSSVNATFCAIPSAGHAVFLDAGCTETVAQWILNQS
ncbi:MAG: alpha/beta hydrolase [Capsulimonadaceae bacterium]|nr:alpha/beta hydrolase [Capsulimonadaceae bacterium]